MTRALLKPPSLSYLSLPNAPLPDFVLYPLQSEMIRIGPYSAWIGVDGTRLETHNVVATHTIRTSSASGWISSQAGKKFSVYWHNAIRDVPIEAVVLIDGVECHRYVMLASDFPDRPDTVRVSCARTSNATRRDFIFSVVQVTDDENYLSIADPRKLGVITLELWRFHIKRVIRQPLQYEHKSPMLVPQVLHEESKMEGIHYARLGEEYSAPIPTVDMVDGKKIDTVPYASFTFRYRPRDMLLAQGIITRSPSLRPESGTWIERRYRNRDKQQQPPHALRLLPSSHHIKAGRTLRRI